MQALSGLKVIDLTQVMPAGEINTYDQSLGSDHVRERGMVMTGDHPVRGAFRMLGFPVKMGGTPSQVSRPAPALGEHAQQVLSEAGFAPERIAALQANGAFGAAG